MPAHTKDALCPCTGANQQSSPAWSTTSSPRSQKVLPPARPWSSCLPGIRSRYQSLWLRSQTISMSGVRRFNASSHTCPAPTPVRHMTRGIVIFSFLPRRAQLRLGWLRGGHFDASNTSRTHVVLDWAHGQSTCSSKGHNFSTFCSCIFCQDVLCLRFRDDFDFELPCTGGSSRQSACFLRDPGASCCCRSRTRHMSSRTHVVHALVRLFLTCATRMFKPRTFPSTVPRMCCFP